MNDEINDKSESEELFQYLFENSSIAQLLVENNVFIDCNTKALQMIGFSKKEEILGLYPSEISPEFQPDGTSSAIKAKHTLSTAAENGSLEFEWMHQKKNKEPIYILVMLSVIKFKGKILLHAAWTDITQRKKVEDDLRVSEERYRTLANVSFEGILVHDEGIAYDVNQAFCRMFGYEREELIGKNVIDLLFTEQYRPIGYEKVRTKYEKPYEALMKKKDGTLFWIEIVGKLFKFYDKMLRVVAIRDITERRTAEEVLKQSELRFRTIFEFANLSILIHDARTGAIIDANKKAFDIFGISSLDALRKGGFWADHPYSFNDGLRMIHKAATQGPQSFEWQIKHSDGRLRWLEVSLNQIKVNGIDAVIAMSNDITDRKNALQKLQESEDKFRRITESSLDVFISTDKSGLIQFVSPSITRYTGFAPVDLIGRQILTLVLEWQDIRFSNRIKDALDGKAVGLFETYMLKKDGSLAEIEASIVPIKTSANVTNYEIYARDISDRKKLEKELIRTSEQERQRIGQDLHDGLGQTLTGISIMLGTIGRKVQLKKKVTYVEIIRIAKRVEEAIETTRQTARGLYPVTMEKSGLISALREMAHVVKTNYGVDVIITSHGSQSARDSYTSNQLYYITFEAVNNAIKHSKSKKINIHIDINEKKLILSIENNISAKAMLSDSDGMGIKIMQYRANMIGAVFSVKQTKKFFRIKVEIHYQ